jgi:membrane dipeptidase
MGYANNVSAVDLNGRMPGDVDIPRLREGRVGGFFWSVYTGCPSKKDQSKDFTKPHNAVRDTLEQIDVAKQLMDKHSDVGPLVCSNPRVLTCPPRRSRL